MDNKKSSIKNILPESLRIWIGRKILKRDIPDYWGGKRFCPVCETKIKYFIPLPEYYKENITRYDFVYKDMQPETLNPDEYLCPCCYSNDRDRLLVAYFQKYFGHLNISRKYNFLDFAPGKAIDRYFRKIKFLNYRTADLMIDDVDDKGVNIEKMSRYQNEQFDFFICSHVLEHVEHPDAALSELYRVTKKGGRGALLVPIVIGLEQTAENPEHKTAGERWKYYGQDDHLRMFGKTDFINRIKNAGFEVELVSAEEILGNDIGKYGISKSSLLYLAIKK